MEPKHSYILYGLNVKSDIDLPAQPGFPEVPGDLFFRLLPPSPEPSQDESNGWVVEVGDTETKLAIAGVGTYRIRNGNEVLIQPLPGVEVSRLRIYMMASVLGLLLHQRGLLVLHASAIKVGGQAALFLGESGFGKSSIAAALYLKGYSLIADDLAPVELRTNDACITPGFPRLKLYPEIASVLGIDVSRLHVLDGTEAKKAHGVDERFAQGKIPIRWIFVLTKSMEMDIVQPVFQEGVMQLVRHSYPTRLTQSGGMQHFIRCGEIAKRASIFRLRSFTSLSEIREVIQTVEKQFDDSKEHSVTRIDLWS